MLDYRALYESQPSVSVDFLRVVQLSLYWYTYVGETVSIGPSLCSVTDGPHFLSNYGRYHNVPHRRGGGYIVLARNLLPSPLASASASVLASHFLVSMISHEPVGGF